MKQQTSTMLILLATLLIGMAIGFFIPRPSSWQPFAANGPGARQGYMNSPRGAGQPGYGLQQLENKLNLTRQQREAFEQAVLRHRDSMRTVMNRQRLTARQHMQGLNKDLRTILNDQQYQQWEQFYQRRMQNMGRRGMGPGMGRGRWQQ